MKVYEVSYWAEGPGRSHTEVVLILAATKKDAIKFTIKNQGIYSNDVPYVKAKLFKVKDGLFIKSLKEIY